MRGPGLDIIFMKALSKVNVKHLQCVTLMNVMFQLLLYRTLHSVVSGSG